MNAVNDLSKMDPNSFQHLVNHLALKVLGFGHTGFGPGSDGGRDGCFEGEAAYPSDVDRWKGKWYIQSKYHSFHLSADPQKWLQKQIKIELDNFKNPDSQREWPDIWIVATNVDISAVPNVGTFDVCRKLVEEVNPKLAKKFHIWGASKIVDLLTLNKDIAEYYSHFITPGNVISELFNYLKDQTVDVESLITFFITRQFTENQYTKLEQAGSDSDSRPGIHKLFIDIPYSCNIADSEGMVMESLVSASSKCQKIDPSFIYRSNWESWNKNPYRSRVLFLKGGPGHGKSTVGQYFSQIQRASIILQKSDLNFRPQIIELATEIKTTAEAKGFWPTVPRIPILIELKEYAQWYGERNSNMAKGVLSFLSNKLSNATESEITPQLLKKALSNNCWFVNFDGLDEVPHDVKDQIANEVLIFLNNTSVEANSDLLALCTSRPQGYSGQFNSIDGPELELVPLNVEQALNCAKPVLALGRSTEESDKSFSVLVSATSSISVCELMTTPLQSHIMAVVVRDGGRPPERRWQLFSNFYSVIKRREANRDLPDKKLAKLLREEDKLLKSVHNRLGFLLHARAEISKGAQTQLERNEFVQLMRSAVDQMIDGNKEEIISTLIDATANRLVLVNTPDDGDHFRFDIRQLQEYFAAEFLYESVNAENLSKRLSLISGDAHWREVMHFLISALIENNRITELAVAIKAIEELNEPNNDDQNRLLHKRIAKGCILTGRLFQEGVLEQDKRIRNDFRKCLDPLGGIIDSNAVAQYFDTKSPNTLNWLINYSLDIIKEFDCSENIGAAILLFRILPDNDIRVNQFTKFIKSADIEYISVVYESFNFDEMYGSKIVIQDWVIDLSLDYLLDTKWYRFKGDVIRQMLLCVGRDKVALERVGSKKGLNSVVIKILSELGQRDMHYKTEDEKIDYGVVTGSYFNKDWSNSKKTIPAWWLGNEDKLVNVVGIVEAGVKIFRYSFDRSFEKFKVLMEYLVKDKYDWLNGIPKNILALIPLDSSKDFSIQIELLSTLSEEEYRNLIEYHIVNKIRVPRPRKLLQLGYNFDVVKWKELLSDLPMIALHVWARDEWHQTEHTFIDISETLRSIEPTNILLDKLLTDNMLNLIPSKWGALIGICPDREEEIRKALLSYDFDANMEEMLSVEWTPFSINLPQEEHLIVPLLYCILRYDENQMFSKKYKSQLGVVAKKIRDLDLSIDSLESLCKSSNPKVAITANNCLLLLSKSEDYDKYIDNITLLYYPEIGQWFYSNITSSIRLLGLENRESIKTLLSKILDATRLNYSSRIKFNQMFVRWRELSNAPVTSANCQNQWLLGVE